MVKSFVSIVEFANFKYPLKFAQQGLKSPKSNTGFVETYSLLNVGDWLSTKSDTTCIHHSPSSIVVWALLHYIDAILCFTAVRIHIH